MYASDFPHENNLMKVKDDIREFKDFEGISEETKQKILFDNAMSFYHITS
jgi:predicted TIM-barrel fold metal-dependent hydrolase